MILLLPVACGRNQTAEQVDCDINAGSCMKTIPAGEPLTVTFEVTPRPVAAMKRLQFRVTVRDKHGPLRDAGVAIDLAMPGMLMMENRILLRQQDDYSHLGDGVIVKCSSGKKLWRADVRITRPGISVSSPFLFRVDH